MANFGLIVQPGRLDLNFPLSKMKRIFLSDPSPIIGIWQPLSVTHLLTDSLTDSRLVNLIDVTMACEGAYSKLVEVVTVADNDDENRVGNRLLQIWN